MLSRLSVLAAGLLTLFAISGSGCDTLPVDPYATFNSASQFDFAIPTGTTTADTIVRSLAMLNLDSTLAANNSDSMLVKTGQIDRVLLHSTDPQFTLDNLTYAAIVIGSDTVAFDSIPEFTMDTLSLTVNHKDLSLNLAQSMLPVTLLFKLNTPNAQNEILTADITTIYTTGTR